MSETKTELEVLHTSCKECVFANYEYVDDEKMDCQTGCTVGRLEKYKLEGVTFVEAYDSECGFTIINGRLCPYHRNVHSEWAKNNHPANYAAIARKEMTIVTDIVVYLSEEQKDIVEGLTKTINSLKGLMLKPYTVSIVNNQKAVGPAELVALLSREAQGLNWTLTDVLERTEDDKRMDMDRCVDIAVNKLKGHYYTLLFPAQILPETFTLDIDKAVVDNMLRFVVLVPNKEGVGLTVSQAFHKSPIVDGNKPIKCTDFENKDAETSKCTILNTVVEKAKYLASAGNPNIIIPVETVCPNLA